MKIIEQQQDKLQKFFENKLDPPKFKKGQKVKTKHGNGVVLGVSAHRYYPEDPPVTWLYGVKLDGVKWDTPFLEDEITEL